MRKGDTISIMPSQELAEIKLEGLFGKEGKITDIVCVDKKGIVGCWIQLNEPFQNELEWFVPLPSIAIKEHHMKF